LVDGGDEDLRSRVSMLSQTAALRAVSITLDEVTLHFHLTPAPFESSMVAHDVRRAV
jgi:hypothetical protein